MRKNEVHRGDVWWAEVKYSNGVRMNWGTRPFVIISCEMNNDNCQNVTAIPCTTRVKARIQSHAYADINGRLNTIQCEQVQTFGKECLGDFIGRLSREEMESVELALKIHLGLWRGSDEA